MELLHCYLPLFRNVLQITSEPQHFTDYESVRENCVRQLEQSVNEACNLDIGENEKEIACFAVIAWIDEMILRSELLWKPRWQSELLQRKYLNITVAGARFYTLLAQLSPDWQQARCIFLFCLQNGFQGQYNSQTDRTKLASIEFTLREQCLPPPWQIWPNDAEITPYNTNIQPECFLHKHSFMKITVALAFLYASIFIAFYHYIF